MKFHIAQIEHCQVSDCDKIATVRCGTWSFCTEHAISTAKVVLNEYGWGDGNWGTAHASDPEVIAQIRKNQRVIDLGFFEYQP